MSPADDASAARLGTSDSPKAKGRVGRMLSGSRDAMRIVYRDPEHVSERLTLYAADRLADPSHEWAQSALTTRAGDGPAKIADELRTQSAHVARIDGAISGTPFFIALVPGYLSYLWQEMRMTLRIAALYGRDPRLPRTAAETLALRGVHPSVDDAAAALEKVRATPVPDRPTKRRSLRTWVNSVYRLLVFGGFLSPSDAKPLQRTAVDRIKSLLSLLVGGVIWVLTWVLPLTFMILMAWGCETHARQLGRRALVFYEGDAESVDTAIAAADQRQDRGHDKRAILRTVALFLSVAIPIAFVGYVQHVRKTVGFNGLVALGAVVALSLVMATAVAANRR